MDAYIGRLYRENIPRNILRQLYKKLKAGDEGLRPQYNELTRTVRKLTKMLKTHTS